MTTGSLILIALGLSMDAFAVSVINGMCCRRSLGKNALACGLVFGFFQGAMPLLGYFLGHVFSDAVSAIDHWIALLLLGGIGGKMIFDSVRDRRSPPTCAVQKELDSKTLLLQAVATSIDAFAVGINLGILGANVLFAAGIIALVTCVCSFFGVLIGKVAGDVVKEKAEMLGGVILIITGLKIFGEHVGFF